MIKVTEEYFIDADSYCYTVKKLGYDKKNDEVRYDALTYHSHLHEALGSILNRLQRSSVSDNDMSLTETLEKFKALKNEILSVLESVHEVEVVKDE